MNEPLYFAFGSNSRLAQHFFTKCLHNNLSVPLRNGIQSSRPHGLRGRPDGAPGQGGSLRRHQVQDQGGLGDLPEGRARLHGRGPRLLRFRGRSQVVHLRRQGWDSPFEVFREVDRLVRQRVRVRLQGGRSCELYGVEGGLSVALKGAVVFLFTNRIVCCRFSY